MNENEESTILNETRKALENSELEKSLERVRRLQTSGNLPGSHGMAIELALVMALELRAGKKVGSDSAPLVRSWAEKCDKKEVDDAVLFARQFLLEPAKLAESLSARLFEKDSGT